MTDFLSAMFSFTDPLIFVFSLVSGVLFGWLVLEWLLPMYIGSISKLSLLIAAPGVVFFVDQAFIRYLEAGPTWPRSLGTAVAWTLYSLVIVLGYRLRRRFT